MKSITEYTDDLMIRINEKEKLRSKKRRAALSAAAVLSICVTVTAAAVPVLVRPVKTPVQIPVGTAEGSDVSITAELAVDKSDKFVLTDPDYGYAENAGGDAISNRLLFSGLTAFTGGGKTYFSLNEDGPIYYFDGESVIKFTGRFSNGVYFGAAYHDGYVYMPATSEVICGDVRTNGISRYNPETRKTESVIASDGAVGSVVIIGNSMFYTSQKSGKPVIRMCDLESGTIYTVASLPSGDGAAWISFCGDRLAVLCGRVLYTVTFDGTVAKIAEDVSAMTSGKDKIYAYRGTAGQYAQYNWVSYLRRGGTDSVDVYSALTGEKLGEYENDGYVLAFDVLGQRIPAIKNGSLFLIDPLSGEAEKMIESGSGVFFIGNAGGNLLAVNVTGYYNGAATGDMYLISDSGVVFTGKMPSFSSGHVKVNFTDADKACEEYLYEKIELPIEFDRLSVTEIYCHDSVHFYTGSGEELREREMGNVYITAYLGEKQINISVSQEKRTSDAVPGENFYDPEGMESALLKTETLPIKIEMNSGTEFWDLIRQSGKFRGMIRWYEDPNGVTELCEIKLICETDNYITVVHIESESGNMDAAISLLRLG